MHRCLARIYQLKMRKVADDQIGDKVIQNKIIRDDSSFG